MSKIRSLNEEAITYFGNTVKKHYPTEKTPIINLKEYVEIDDIGFLPLSNNERKRKKLEKVYYLKTADDNDKLNLIVRADGTILARIGAGRFEASKEIWNKEIIKAMKRAIEVEQEEAENEKKEISENEIEDEQKSLYGHKGHEDENDEKDKEKNKIKLNGKEDKLNKEKEKKQKKDTKLRNYKKDGLSIYHKTKIYMYEMINGYPLWQLLNLDEKLKGKLPNELDPKSFRTGFLVPFKSSELTEKDGKKRKSEYTMTACTLNGDIIELDETILQPENVDKSTQTVNQEKDEIRNADGIETGKPIDTNDITKVASWRIVDAQKRFPTSEYWWGFQININENYKRHGIEPLNGNKEEVSFWQSVARDYEENEEGLGRNSQKLEANNEVEESDEKRRIEEKIQRKKLEEFDPYEAGKDRIAHIEEIVKKLSDEVKKRYENMPTKLRNDIIELHQNGFSDERIVEYLNKVIYFENESNEKMEEGYRFLGDGARKK